MKSTTILTLLITITLGHLTFAQPPEVEWDRIYGGAESDIAYSVQQTTDGGYIFAGYTKSFGADSNDVYLVKTDSFGNVQWYRLYGGADYDEALSVAQTTDGGYILAGVTCSFGTDCDMHLVKTDSIGDTLWTRTYGGIDDDEVRSILQTMDGGYIMTGWTDSYGAGSDDIYVIKTDILGELIWTRTFGGSDYDWAYDIKQTIDEGFVIVGNTSSYGAGESDLYLVRLNSLGDTLWTLIYGGVDWERVYSVDFTNDGGYIIAGEVFDWVSPGYCWLLKTGPDTSTSHAPVIEWVSHPKDFILHPAYPNPFNPTTTISYNVPVQGIVKVNIYNVLGQKTAELVNGITTPGHHHLTWNAADFPSGIYFIQLTTSDYNQTRKILLLK